MLGLFFDETSLLWGQKPQSLSLPLLPRPPERQAQDHLGSVQKELCSTSERCLTTQPAPEMTKSYLSVPTPTSMRERLYLLVTDEPPVPTWSQAEKGSVE